MITSAANPRLKLVRRLASRRQRERLGLFACEGEDLVVAALDAGLEPVEVLIDGERPVLVERLPHAELVAPALFRDFSALGHHARVLAVFRGSDLPALRDPPPPAGLGLWRVADPGNLGTLLRAADAFGPAFVALSPGCADPTGAKALRASAGAVFRVPLGAFEAAPRPWVALTPRAGTPIDVLAYGNRATFLLGSERAGLPADIVERCDQTAWIPQTGRAESLNVAMAGTLALWEWARRGGG
ncbi:MAG: TrmH family RNA methyltransferase [Gaiellaceae bacterium]